MKKMKTITCFGKSYLVEHSLSTYNTGNLAVQLGCVTGSFGTLSVNVPGVELAANEFCVKTWSENDPWALNYLEQNSETFEDTGRKFTSGFVTGPIYRLKLD